MSTVFWFAKVYRVKRQGGFVMYSYQEVLEFVKQEDVKFIRLAFFDVFGTQKNVSIMPQELTR